MAHLVPLFARKRMLNREGIMEAHQANPYYLPAHLVHVAIQIVMEGQMTEC
jgi:hypothetical protein